ncbi:MULTISPECIES: winged helix-turn-helix transcriptional regulator [unclassified Rhodococcus (in: high G+C Gram-positive bacteria)]|uniref:winged helix-turn-helix transcriptional regulator n=1 Tax=unclassified Rhodococcus (in: high G+C Gram-positive bacteria) TaxID=192944 RepID=UPI0006F5B0EB|nr:MULTISPECIES: helix-turn-helix domain-containing protein [unclassified Rhodococcus (in: high G+C Gram-positive bacteria)]KQU28523.1 transcriptional regulator [Rhodococcus sp. Leaf225]KQU44428.1 transcriptional regulator [Rhodococcus sp. Leaf258]
MKSYGEFCALARALDVIGDRWTMLVIRELLIGPSRYSDLHRSLPGIATNLLAQRLRSLEDAGVVRSSDDPAPVSARVYSLTEWGRGLRRPLVELARWGVPLMAAGVNGDHTRGPWLGFAVMALYPERDGTTYPDVTVRLDADGATLLLASTADGVTTTAPGPDAVADVVVTGTSEQIFRTLSADRTGGEHARVTGASDALQRFFELTASVPASAVSA